MPKVGIGHKFIYNTNVTCTVFLLKFGTLEIYKIILAQIIRGKTGKKGALASVPKIRRVVHKVV